MSLRGGGGHHGGHGGGHGGYGMYPPWYSQVGYPVAYNVYYGANQCPDTYCPVHDDKCECYCMYRRPLKERAGGGSLSGLGQHHQTAYGFKSAYGVPLPADVWWAQRCPDTTCPRHKDMCDCTCPFRVPKTRPAAKVWDIDLSGWTDLSPFSKLLGGLVAVAIVAAVVIPALSND